VEFFVEIERIRDGKRETRRMLEHKMLAADLAGVPVGLFHERKADASTPVLVVGERLIRGESFQSPLVIGLGGARAPLVNPFATGAERLSAEWLKFRFTSPSGERQAVYTIVDTEGPAARQSTAPPREATAEDTRAVLAALEDFLGISIATGQLPAVVLGALLADLPRPMTEAGLIRMLAAESTAYVVARGSIPSSFFPSLPVSYIDSPTVVIARLRPPQGPDVPASLSLDLTLKAYRTLRTPEDPLRNSGSFYDLLAAGILDHTVERWVLGADSAGESVGALFEAAVDHGIPLRVIRSVDQTALDYLTADGRIRLSGLLADRLAILPQGRPPGWQALLGWWNVDPSTGWTEDTTEQGGHSAMGERGAKESASVRAYRAFCRLGRVVGRQVAAVVMLYAVLSGGEGPRPDNPWSDQDIEEVVEFICAIADPEFRSSSKTPRVPPAPMGPRLPEPPPRFQPKPAPNIPRWWSNNGTWRRWR
jgi:hypothetical protein